MGAGLSKQLQHSMAQSKAHVFAGVILDMHGCLQQCVFAGAICVSVRVCDFWNRVYMCVCGFWWNVRGDSNQGHCCQSFVQVAELENDGLVVRSTWLRRLMSAFKSKLRAGRFSCQVRKCMVSRRVSY